MLSNKLPTKTEVSKQPYSVVISQRFFPHYRMNVFNSINDDLQHQNIGFHLLYSLEMGNFTAPPWALKILHVSRPLRVGEIEETFVLSYGLLPKLVKISPSVMIVEDLAGLPNSVMAMVYCLLTRTPYLIWGLGRIPHKSESILRRLLNPLIRLFYARCSGFICYSKHAQEVYRPYGKPTYVAHNACLAAPTEEEAVRSVQASMARINNPTLKLVTVGALKGQKRIEVLIEAIGSICKFNTELHVIGEGPLRTRLEQLALELGIESKVIFHGAIYNQEEKRQIITKCHLGVLPGRGGLAIQEILWHGLPVVSGVADGTERDLINNNVNGYLFDGFMTPDNIRQALEAYVGLSNEEKEAMTLAALDTVKNHSNVEIMKDGFSKAIYSTLNLRVFNTPKT